MRLLASGQKVVILDNFDPYYDVRLKFDRNTAGEVLVSRVNPRTVLPDPDASDYDPDTWDDVVVTSP